MFVTIYLQTADIHIMCRYFYNRPSYQILHTRSQWIINYSIRRKFKCNFRGTFFFVYITSAQLETFSNIRDIINYILNWFFIVQFDAQLSSSST